MNLQKLWKTSKNKSPLPFKESLTILQNEDKLTINGMLSKDYCEVKGIWIRSRQTEEEWLVAVNSLKGKEFEFHVNLSDLMNLLEPLKEENFDWYLKLSVPLESLSDSFKQKLHEKASIISENNVVKAEYLIRLGRFQKTNIEGMRIVHNDMSFGICYLTKKGNISLALNKVPSLDTKLQIDRVYGQTHSLKIEGKLFTKGSSVVQGKVILKGRNSGEEIENKVSIVFNKEETELKYGMNRYQYSSVIDFKDLSLQERLKEDIYDLYLRIQFDNQLEEKNLRIGRPAFRARHFLKESYSFFKNKSFIVSPYYTFKGLNLSLEVFEFEKDTFDYLQKKLKFAWLHRFLGRNKDIWVVGERPYKAQDNGYAFFKYMRQNHPEKNVYYVIEKDSPERVKVEPLGNVLIYKSEEHILKTIQARRIIGTHHPDFLYPVRSKRFKRAVKGTKVFLQHGVMGTKNMIANYGKKAAGFETDLFLVSSQFEKEMIVNDFEYSPKDVFITGLSRFDSLLANDVKIKRQILIIPTWRDWVTTEEVFLESEYFSRYKNLLHHPDLLALTKEYDVEIVFCLHPNMQNYTHHFKDAPVRIISQGEVDVQHLIKESALMVTDYSSVAFDFSFLYKPVLYYQFDRNRFIGKRPSHLDLDNDLPGDIFDNENQLLAQINYYVRNDFEASEENKRKADKFLTYRDLKSSERVYEVIKNYKLKKGEGLLKKGLKNDLLLGIFNRFRKSKYYFPTMKSFYRAAKSILPVDDKLILFESGVGKQYADSPRRIYEEIVERNLDYKKVWVTNKNIRFSDDNTIKVKRLSPQYYYYLAKAKFWINNQNFPTYIQKRKETTYIQTWHGTPLKKMLFDIKNIQGRDETYLERVHSATKTWDYLISPSEYASKAFRSAFRYEGEILEIGYPRNDIFYDNNHVDIIKKVKNQIKVPDDKKIILYAPTFRDNETIGKNKFQFNLNMDLQQLKEDIGDEYILLMKMHVVISNKLKIEDELKDFVYNVSSYPDIQDLCLISDILMTDYSSVMFDFANTGKPLLLFTYDLDLYKNDVRGFYMNFEEEAPGPLLFNTWDIIKAVTDIENVQVQYQEKYKVFRDKYCSLEDGKAAARVVDKFFD